MDDVKQMFRNILNGQSAMKSKLIGEIRKVDKMVDDLETKVDQGFQNMKSEFKKVNQKIDKLGSQIANLVDDAPTVEEFDKLEKRVSKVEQKVAAL